MKRQINKRYEFVYILVLIKVFIVECGKDYSGI